MPQQPNSGWTPVEEPSGWTAVEEPKTAAPSQDKTPGFFKRLGQGVGVPTSAEEAKALQPSTTEKVVSAVAPGAVPAGEAAYSFGKGLYAAGKTLAKESREAGENIAEGGPVGANIGKAGAAATETMLRSVLGPVGGGALQAWGEDIHAQNYRGAAGDALAVLINGLLLKGATKLPEKQRISKINYAGDLPETLHPAEHIKDVLPDLTKAAGTSGAPKTVGELSETVQRAKAGINNEVGRAIFPIRGKQTVPLSISDAIKSHITPDMAQTAEGRQMQTALQKAAVDYQKPWTYEQLHAARINANARLRAFFKKAGSAQYGDMKTDVGVIVDRELARGVQDIVYPEMDKAAGRPPGYFSKLLNRQGTLIAMSDSVKEQATALAMRTSKLQGAPRFSSENVSAYGHPASAPGFSIHKLQNVFIRPNPLGQANAAVGRAFAGRPGATAGILSLPVRELLLQPWQQPVENRRDALQLLNRPTP